MGAEIATAPWLIAQGACRSYDRFEAELRAHALPPEACGILLALFDLGDTPQQTVRALLGIPKHEMVDLLDVLEGRGLVLRRRYSADRRIQLLALTGQGRHLVGDVLVELTKRVDDEFAAELAELDQQLLRRVLTQAIAHHKIENP
jgi:DNA-binding MarR family transcriptional regulator